MQRTSFIATAWSVVLGLGIGASQAQKIDVERELTMRLGFTAAEVAQARGGKAVAKLLPTKDGAEIGVVAAVRMNAKADRLVYWFKEIANFRKAAELGLSRRISDEPQIGDFGDLSLDSDELAALKKCRPGNCDLLLGDKGIQQFQALDWKAADVARRANLLLREMFLGYARAYLKGGDEALGAIHNDKTPRVRASDFRQLLSQSRGLYGLAAPLAGYLEGFPTAALPESEQFLYWGKGGAGPDASISLHQLVFYHPAGGDVLIVDKQLYASRYVEAAVTVVSLASAPTGDGFYAVVGSRARSSSLNGMGARLLRGKVEKATRETAAMYLDWLRASLANSN